MTLRDDILGLLDDDGPLSTPAVAERLGVSRELVRSALGGLYVRHYVEREMGEVRGAWMWAINPTPPPVRPPPSRPLTTRTPRVTWTPRPEIPIKTEPLPAPPPHIEREPVLSAGEQSRVAQRLRRLLATRRGQPISNGGWT